MRRTRKRRRKGGGLLDQLKKGASAAAAAVRKATGFEKKSKTRAFTPEEVAKLEQMTKDDMEKRRERRGTNAAAAAAGPVIAVPDNRGFYPRDEDGVAIHSVTGTPYGPDGLTINREDRDGQYHALGLRSRHDLGTVARAIHDDEVAWAREHGGAEPTDHMIPLPGNRYESVPHPTLDGLGRGNSNSSWDGPRPMISGPDGRPYEIITNTGEMKKMGGKRKKSRKKRRRKRRRSRRGGQWCKCSDLEKICEKRENRQKRSQESAQKYKERKEAASPYGHGHARGADGLARAVAAPRGEVVRIVGPERSRKNRPRFQREMSEGSFYPRLDGGRKRRRRTRRRRKRRRKRRKTRGKRRRRRTRRKRGGAPKWLDGVDKEYIFKDGGTWFLLRDKNAKNSARPANTYPHLHGGPNWLNCTFAKGDHDEIWSVDMEGYKKGSLDNLKKNIADKGPKPLHLNAATRVEWKKVVVNMKAIGAGGGGGGSGVRSSSPRHRGGPVAMSFKPVTQGEILGKKARTITPPSPFVQEQLRLHHEAEKAAAAKKKEEDDMALAIKLSKQRISPLNVRTELIKRGWNAEDAKWAATRNSTVGGAEKDLWKDRRKPADPFGEANMKNAREEARREQQRLHPSKSRFGFAASDPEPAAAAPKSAMKIDKKKTADLRSVLGEGFFK